MRDPLPHRPRPCLSTRASLWLMLAVTAASPVSAQSTSPQIPTPRTFDHNETVQMMEHPPSGYSAVELQPMIIRGTPEVRLHAMFAFPGETLVRPPGQVSLAIISRGTSTQFADTPSVQLLVGAGAPIKVTATVRLVEREGDGIKETVAMRVSRATFLRLATANRAAIRVDTVELSLGHPQLEALRDLASRMSPEGHRAALARVPVRQQVADFTLRRAAYESPQVDSAARPTMVLERPRFPAGAARETRRVFIHYVVDTTGRVDVESLSSRDAARDSLFLASLRDVIPQWEFAPAMLGGKRVRQIVRQLIVFEPADER